MQSKELPNILFDYKMLLYILQNKNTDIYTQTGFITDVHYFPISVPNFLYSCSGAEMWTEPGNLKKKRWGKTPRHFIVKKNENVH